MLSRTILPAIAGILTNTLPTCYWYRCARIVSYLIAGVLCHGRWATKPHRFEQAILLNRLLAFLTRSRKEFHVPWCWSGDSEAIVDGAAAQGRGVIYCSAHLPLIKVAVRALMETGRTPAVALAAEPGHDLHIPIWGLRERMPVLKVQADVLLKTRTLLRAGGAVLLLADTVKGQYSPNIFRLAAALRAKVIFFTAELEDGGMVAVRFFPAPCPACRDTTEISANLHALNREIVRISGRDQSAAFDTVPASRLT